MLLVPTFIAASGIHGIGLFAARDIARGESLWEFTRGLDVRFEFEDVGRLPAHVQRRIRHYCYVNPARPGALVLCGDDARFWNFAADPNAIEDAPPRHDRESVLVAARPIAAGEELTVGLETDADAARKLSHR